MKKLKCILLLSLLCLFSLSACENKKENINKKTNSSKTNDNDIIKSLDKVDELGDVNQIINNAYVDEDSNLHVNPKGEKSSVIEGPLSYHSSELTYSIWTGEPNFAYESKFVVIGQDGNILLDTNYYGDVLEISPNEFCIVENINGNRTLVRYKITDEKAETIWQKDLIELCGEYVGYEDNNMYQALFASKDNSYVINLDNGEKVFSMSNGDGAIYLKEKDIYVNNGMSDTITTYDGSGKEKYTHTFEPDEQVEFFSELNQTNTFKVKVVSDGKYIYKIINTSGEVLATSPEYNYEEENFWRMSYTKNIAVYSSVKSYVVIVDDKVYNVSGATCFDTYLVFENADDGKDYMLILETGVIKEIGEYFDYDYKAGYGWTIKDKNLEFFDKDGNDIYVYETNGSQFSNNIAIMENYYNNTNCSYTYTEIDNKIIIILPYEQKVYEFDNDIIDLSDFSVSVRAYFIKDRYLIYKKGNELYSIDSKDNKAKKILDTEGSLRYISDYIVVVDIEDKTSDKSSNGILYKFN